MGNFCANHHLPEHVLMAYSAGALPEAFSLVVACHISLCDECRATAESCDALGGDFMQNLQPAELQSDSLAATMARIGAAPAPEPVSRPMPARRAGDFPEPLRAYTGANTSEVRWKNLGGGFGQAVLLAKGGESVRLLRIASGTAVPSHGHDGMEMTLVLQGAFSDKYGRFARGDVEFRDEPDSHKPVADAGEDCICLAATEGPLRFDDLLPRLLRPITRI